MQVVMQTPIPFVKNSLEEINNLLNANIKSLTMITYVTMNGMLSRNKGLILNLSAFSGLYPVPFISVYSASKVSVIKFAWQICYPYNRLILLSVTQAYIEFFSRCISLECKSTDVVVQTVTPGFIKVEDNNEETPMSYILPTMNNFVRNTIDSLAVSPRISGSWLFSLEVRIFKLKRFRVVHSRIYNNSYY